MLSRVSTRFFKWWAPLLVGGGVLQINLTGCDPEVRDAVLTGIQDAMVGLISAIIEAFFLSLKDIGGSTTRSAVQATLEGIQGWLA